MVGMSPHYVIGLLVQALRRLSTGALNKPGIEYSEALASNQTVQ